MKKGKPENLAQKWIETASTDIKLKMFLIFESKVGRDEILAGQLRTGEW